jgi:hypothetical protein
MVYNESRGGWLATLSLYVAWLITSIGAVIDALALREMFLSFLSWYSVVNQQNYHAQGGVGQDIFTGFGLSAADDALLLILGIGAVSATVYVEYYYRKGRPKGLLYKRIGKVALIEVAIFIVAFLVRMLVASILQNTPS